ncbi:MAG: hypothetical protein J7L89_03735 [Bacteroidales bacterium]|nr:hypothetical protein [Bacteroidales bacterium]
MELLIGLDDTDSKTSRGTGYRARQMASELTWAGFGKVLGVTRHQLLVHPDVPYTSHNSANCLQVDTKNPEGLTAFCRDFLIRESLPEADAGLCVTPATQITDKIEEWGRQAKQKVLTQKNAETLAQQAGVYLEGLTGTHDGIIGALAAVGLRYSGNDGRLIWQPGKPVRDLTGFMTVGELLKGTRVDFVMSKEGKILDPDEIIDLTDWVRAVLINHKAIILAEKNLKKTGHAWKTADKEYIKSLTS